MALTKLALHGGSPIRTEPYPVWPRLGDGDLERVSEVLNTPGWGGSSASVTEFETVFAQVHDATHGIAVANGSLALELALLAADVGPGDEVIVPAHSFIATATAVSRIGAIPVFADIEATTYNLSVERIAEAASDKTAAVIVVHFGGVMADMDGIGALATEHGFLVIEDAAHAHGAEWHGKRAGSFGLAGTFSFQNSKAMTAGEGGIVITSDDEFASKARSIGNAGRRPDRGWFEHFELGTNLRMTAIQAAILSKQLERLTLDVQLREDNNAAFEQALTGIDGLYLQEAPAGVSTQTCYLRPGRILEDSFGVGRDEFVEAMNAEGIPVRPFYPHPLYENPVFKDHEHRVTECPVAAQSSKDSFWLPMNLFMGSEEDAVDAARAIQKIHKVMRGKTKKPHVNGSAATAPPMPKVN
jgi:dTDP-4-amino-4,6-dideoxygalactose transaminase